MLSLPTLEHHVSLQGYIDDEPVCSQLAFDIDCDNDLEKALHITKMVEEKLDMNNISYTTYFSGSKGFHVMANTLIHGRNSNKVCKEIMQRHFNFECMDDHIYRGQGTLRATGSVNSKSGLYKTAISSSQSIEDILIKAQVQPEMVANYPEIICNGFVLTKGIVQARTQKPMSLENSIDSTYVTPCITKMIADDDPPRDLWHGMIYTISKHCLTSGMDIDDAELLFDNSFFGNAYDGYTRNSYMKVLRSVYRKDDKTIGCKTGISSACMQHYCGGLCIFLDNDWGKYVPF